MPTATSCGFPAVGGCSRRQDVCWIAPWKKLSISILFVLGVFLWLHHQRRETTAELLLKDWAPVRLWPQPSRGMMSPSDQENGPNWSPLLPPFPFPRISCLIGSKPGSRVCGHLSSFSFLLRVTEPDTPTSGSREPRQGLDRAVWAEGPAHTGIKHVMASVGPRVG